MLATWFTEGKVEIDAATNLFNAHSVSRTWRPPDDIQTLV